MSDAANIHSCHLADATTARALFDTPDAFSSGGSPTTDPRQDGYQSQALLNYTVYTQFLADITGVNQTIGANTYTPRAINASVYSWVRFDIESWVQSDVTEKADPQTYIGNFIALAHAHAFKCIITPGRDLGNTDTAHPKLTGESLDQWYVRTNLAAACAGADAFEVQDQANQVTPAEFARFFSTVPAQAKAASANLPVWCGLSTTPGNGLRRRPGQGSNPLNPPMTRYWQTQAGAVAPVAYWTCEDGPRSSQIASGLPGGLPLAFANGTPNLASDSSFIASAPLPVLNGATLGAGIPVYTGTDCVFTFLVHVPAAGDTDGSILFSAKLDGSISELRLTYNTLNGGTLTARPLPAAGAC